MSKCWRLAKKCLMGPQLNMWAGPCDTGRRVAAAGAWNSNWVGCSWAIVAVVGGACNRRAELWACSGERTRSSPPGMHSTIGHTRRTG